MFFHYTLIHNPIRLEDGHDVLDDVMDPVFEDNIPLGHQVRQFGENLSHPGLALQEAETSKEFSLFEILCAREREHNS